MIIGLTGHKGSGKDTAAKALPGAHDTKMADPLKQMMRAFYKSAGLGSIQIERKIEGDLKEVPCELLLGKTPRYAMQKLGHEWRNFFGEDLWTNLWLARMEGVSILDTVFVTDVRYPHEAAAVRKLGGLIVSIDRPGLDIDLSHPSEAEILKVKATADVIILNDGTADQLQERVRDVCES